MRTKIHGALWAFLGLLLVSLPAFAHHSFTAEFDGQKLVTVKGILKKVDWINPHVYIYVDAKGENGAVASWTIETWPTGLLHRAGINRNMFVEGQPITVIGYPAKDGTRNFVYIGRVTFPDGHSVDLRNNDRVDPGDSSPKQ